MDGVPFRQSFRAIFLRALGKQLKAIGQEAGNLGIPVLAGTANAAACLEGSMPAKRQGALTDVVAKGNRFLGEILHHVQTNRVIKLVHVGGVL